MLRLLSKKFGHKENGFTLVELMIVISVIALLMLVLVPRIGVLRNKSREAGIKSNMLMLEGVIQNVIDEYPATADGMIALETKVANDLKAADADTNQAMRNPFTSSTGVLTLTELADVSNVSAAVIYDLTAADDDEAEVDGHFTANIAKASGAIGFGAYAQNNKIYVKLIPYGWDDETVADGADRIDNLIKIISQ